MSDLRIIAVDDEPLALDRLRILLDQCEGVNLIACANGCKSATAAIERYNPDLLLLDIQMRDGSAFDLLQGIAEEQAPLIAFVTAYPRYACQAFRVSALDYLLKPVELSNLKDVIRKAAERREMTSAHERLTELHRLVEELREDNRLIARKSPDTDIWIRQRGTDHVRIAADRIDWVRAEDDYACIHSEGREHLLRTSLDRLADMLDPTQFTRIHRAILVRNDRITKVALKRVGVREVILSDGTRLPIGRIHARNLDWRKGNVTAR